MAQHILHLAGEDIAQVVKRGGGDVAIVLEGIQRPTAEGVVLDQRVGGDSLALHGLPERVVHDDRNHLACRCYYISCGTS